MFPSLKTELCVDSVPSGGDTADCSHMKTVGLSALGFRRNVNMREKET